MTSVICAAPPPPTSAPAHSRATRSGAAAPPAPHGRTLARGTILPVEMDRRSKMTEYRHFIGGQWTPASGGATYEDRNPYTGEVLAKVAAGTREDARRAVEAAQAAFGAWSQTPPAERQRIFLAAADILERRSDEVVGL